MEKTDPNTIEAEELQDIIDRVQNNAFIQLGLPPILLEKELIDAFRTSHLDTKSILAQRIGVTLKDLEIYRNLIEEPKISDIEAIENVKRAAARVDMELENLNKLLLKEKSQKNRARAIRRYGITLNVNAKEMEAYFSHITQEK